MKNLDLFIFKFMLKGVPVLLVTMGLLCLFYILFVMEPISAYASNACLSKGYIRHEVSFDLDIRHEGSFDLDIYCVRTEFQKEVRVPLAALLHP